MQYAQKKNEKNRQGICHYALSYPLSSIIGRAAKGVNTAVRGAACFLHNHLIWLAAFSLAIATDICAASCLGAKDPYLSCKNKSQNNKNKKG
jgi:hypothetical protein